jgi:hypothetical protein
MESIGEMSKEEFAPGLGPRASRLPLMIQAAL